MLKFGIYTTFYNCERFIDKIFSSIEKIDYPEFEWHITDDFSTDDTKKMLLSRLERSQIKDKILYFDQQEKKQMYWKPNLFFDSSFDWIVLVDADDDFDKDFLYVYNSFLKNREDVSLVSSDFFKINEDTNSLHSISYILNEDIISNKILNYHPQCDYLNNISYSCFGHLRGFKNIIPSFDVDDMLACAEDSYHIFWSNSYGKYLHIPRPLYFWFLRGDSESHGKSIPENFNGNFEISLNRLKSSDFGIDTYFNEIYLETCALGSCEIGLLKDKKVSIWSRNLSEIQKQKLKNLYPESHLSFNSEDPEFHIFVLNFFNDKDLEYIVEKIRDRRILFYYQNQKYHSKGDLRDDELKSQIDYYGRSIGKFVNYNWWTYIRHFIIKNW